MRSGWLLAAVLAACYEPTLHEGAPCGPGASCPTGQECRAGTCYFVTTPADANLFGDAIELDGSMITTDAPPDGAPYVAWSTPVELTTLETVYDGEDDPSITTDLKTVAMKGSVNGTSDDDLLICTRATAMTDAFTCTPLTALNSTSTESSPEISADGKTIYFVSDRTTAGNGDVWVSTEVGGVWSTPTMDAALSAGDVGDLAISPDGLTALIHHGGTFYIRTRTSTAAGWSSEVAHSEIAVTAGSETAPTITNGAQTVYFHAGATRDIYVTHRNANGTFQTPTAVTELNMTATRDAAPFVSQNDKYMIFERDYEILETSR
jgi:hypothetical protein